MVETHHRIRTTGPNLVTLKIKSEDGNHTFKLKMCFSETIGHLRQYLDKHRGSGLSDYDIISVHPRCCYSDESQMLSSCGFTRNTTLLLQKRKCWNLVKIRNYFFLCREESNLQENPNVKQEMMKNFISKICKYKQGQKYENKHLFSLLQKTVEMLRHAEPDLWR